MRMNMNRFYFIILNIFIFSKVILSEDIHFFLPKDEKISQSYVNSLLQESRIFDPIDIRRLCYNLQSESKVYNTIYNVKANFYRYLTRSFSIRDVNLHITQNKVATIAARRCHLLIDKTDQEIFITSLSTNLKDRPCPTCIVMLSCTSEECTLDSVAVIEKLNTEYLSNSVIFPVYKERQNSKGNIITDSINNPNGLKFRPHSENMIQNINELYKTDSPHSDQKIFFIKNLKQLCSELQIASELSKEMVYSFNPNFYTRDDKDFHITVVYFNANQRHGIWARNCHLRNEETNANIYLTGISETHLSSAGLNIFVVVLECHASTCSSNRIFQIRKIKRYDTEKWKFSQYKHWVTRTLKAYNLKYSINLGTKSQDEYLNDLELMYEKEKLQPYDPELMLENEVVESNRSIFFPINMKQLCSEIQLMFPNEYTEANYQFPENNEAEQILLKMPRKYKSTKTISAKKCNLIKTSYNNGIIYLATAPTNTLNWTNTLVVLVCDHYNLCSIDTLLHVDDFWIYAIPQPKKSDKGSDSSNVLSGNKKFDIEHLTQNYILQGSFNNHRIFAELDIKFICGSLADNHLSENPTEEIPTLYNKVHSFEFLKKEAFGNTFVLINDDKGSQKKIKARFCNLKIANTDYFIYVTSPPITDISKPEWRNRITILTCGGKNPLCRVMKTQIIDDFEEKFHIEPIV